MGKGGDFEKCIKWNGFLEVRIDLEILFDYVRIVVKSCVFYSVWVDGRVGKCSFVC